MGLEAALHAATDVLAEFEDRRVGDEIDDGLALAAPADDARVRKGLEVAGNVGLVEAGTVDQRGDVEFARTEDLDQEESAGFAEDPEPRRDQLEAFGTEGWGGLWHDPARKTQNRSGVQKICVSMYIRK